MCQELFLGNWFIFYNFLLLLQIGFFGGCVGAEFFEDALFVAVEEGAVVAEVVGDGGVDEVAGVGGAHLEEDAVVEFAEGLAVEGAFDGGEGVGP